MAEARAAVTSARINLDYTHIEAPIAGKVATSEFTPGALVTRDQASPLTTVRQLDPIRVPDSVAGSGPLSDAVQCQDRGVLKGRGEERTGGVRLVVLGEGDALAIGAPEPATDLPGQV